MRYALAIDIGGTKVATGIISQDGHILKQATVKSDTSNRENMYQSVKQAIADVMTDAPVSWDEIAGIGAGVPGKVDPVKGIAVYQNNIPWHNFPIRERLQNDYPVQNIQLDNDVHMAAYAEWKQAGLAPDALFAYITISTGIACAMLQQGRFLRGAGFAGELGLLPSRCLNKRVTLEQATGGPAIQRVGQDRYQDPSITTKEVFDRFQQNEPIATEIVAQTAEALAEGVYSLVSILDPHHITFGGSVATHNPQFIELVKENLSAWALPDQRHILENINISQYANLSGLVGAGLRVFDTIK
ncbi:ROK family protein [Jeotgalibaca sp. A122]|uniref:ROK family protein n=1 Tax=Jeotgalibaca sp. A122 TaxID=3457322 RepID=UPI003FD546C3